MSLVTIGIAEAKDYARCLPLFKLLYRGDIGQGFRQIFEDYVAKREGTVLLAESPSGLVGILVGSFHLDIDWEGMTSRIDAIVIEEDNRMMGIAKKLVQYFVKTARSRNCKAVKSRINVGNAAAQRFHERLGFTKSDTYEYFLDL